MNEVVLSCSDIEPPQWLSAVEPFVQSVLMHLEYVDWDMSIVFCSDSFIQSLNNTFRHIDKPTDVLSFEDSCRYRTTEGIERYSAGDIVISIPALKSNAVYFNVSVDEELKRLIIHGILHLSGMDHSDNSPLQEMLQLQEKILGLYTNTVIYQE